MASKAEIQAQIAEAVATKVAEVLADRESSDRAETIAMLQSRMGPDRDITSLINQLSCIDPNAAKTEGDPVGNALVYHVSRAIRDLTGRTDAFKTVLKGYLFGINSVGTITAYGDADILLKLLPVAIQHKLEEKDRARAIERVGKYRKKRGSDMKTTVTVELIEQMTKMLSDNGEEDMIVHPASPFSVCEFVNHQQTEEEAAAVEGDKEYWAEKNAARQNNGGAQNAASVFPNLIQTNNKID